MEGMGVEGGREGREGGREGGVGSNSIMGQAVETERELSQSAHPCCLNVYLQLQILAALLQLSAVLNISCTHSAAELLSFSI